MLYHSTHPDFLEDISGPSTYQPSKEKTFFDGNHSLEIQHPRLPSVICSRNLLPRLQEANIPQFWWWIKYKLTVKALEGFYSFLHCNKLIVYFSFTSVASSCKWICWGCNGCQPSWDAQEHLLILSLPNYYAYYYFVFLNWKWSISFFSLSK